MELTPEQLAAAKEVLEKDLEEQLRSRFSEDNQEEIDRIVSERLSDMKKKMDALDAKLAAENKEKLRLEEANKKAERERLEAEGKHLELREMEVQEYRTKYELAQERITQLTRDQAVKDSLAGLDFRNDFARKTAFEAITRELTQNEDGEWRHKTGVSIEEFVKIFKKDPDKEFLFVDKTNTGSGTQTKTGTDKGRPSSLKDLDGKALLELASRGELGSFPI